MIYNINIYSCFQHSSQLIFIALTDFSFNEPFVSNGPPPKDVCAKPEAAETQEVDVVGMDIAVEEFDMVTKAFDRPSEDFVDDMLGTFPALEAKTGQVGAGRIG